LAQARLPIGRSLGLSELEAKCLLLYGAGWSRDEISSVAHVSRRTVGAALTVAKEKLAARSLTHAALLLSGFGRQVESLGELPV
jgi:DNA-binding CsgD family transcriptional regulator